MRCGASREMNSDNEVSLEFVFELARMYPDAMVGTVSLDLSTLSDDELEAVMTTTPQEVETDVLQAILDELVSSLSLLHSITKSESERMRILGVDENTIFFCAMTTFVRESFKLQEATCVAHRVAPLLFRRCIADGFEHAKFFKRARLSRALTTLQRTQLDRAENMIEEYLTHFLKLDASAIANRSCTDDEDWLAGVQITLEARLTELSQLPTLGLPGVGSALLKGWQEGVSAHPPFCNSSGTRAKLLQGLWNTITDKIDVLGEQVMQQEAKLAAAALTQERERLLIAWGQKVAAEKWKEVATRAKAEDNDNTQLWFKWSPSSQNRKLVAKPLPKKAAPPPSSAPSWLTQSLTQETRGNPANRSNIPAPTLKKTAPPPPARSFPAPAPKSPTPALPLARTSSGNTTSKQAAPAPKRWAH